jgi:hypothetical protein
LIGLSGAKARRLTFRSSIPIPPALGTTAQTFDSFGTKRKEPSMMNFGYNSLLGVLILAGDIWAIINIFQSSASNEKKLIWTLAVVLLPVLGLILWYFLGPRDGKV